MVSDARLNTKTWIEAYYTPANAVDDNGHSLGMQAMYDSPEYAMELEFKAPSVIDVIVVIGQSNSTPEVSGDQIVRRYKEQVPIEIYSVNKSGVTAAKAIQQVESEIRRIGEEHPEGSQRTLDRSEPVSRKLGSPILWGCKYVLNYWRGVT